MGKGKTVSKMYWGSQRQRDGENLLEMGGGKGWREEIMLCGVQRGNHAVLISQRSVRSCITVSFSSRKTQKTQKAGKGPSG